MTERDDRRDQSRDTTTERSRPNRTLVRGHHIRSMLPVYLRGKTPEEAAKQTTKTYRAMAWVPGLNLIAFDTIGITRKQRARFTQGIQNTLTELADAPDDHTIQITANGSKDGLCNSTAHGLHCGIKGQFHKDAGFLDIFADRAKELNAGDVAVTSVDGIPDVLTTDAKTFRTVMTKMLPPGATTKDMFGFIKQAFKAEGKYDKQYRKNKKALRNAKRQRHRELPQITTRTITKDPDRDAAIDTRSKPVTLFLTSDTQSEAERAMAFAGHLRDALEAHPERNVLVFAEDQEWTKRIDKIIRTGEDLWRGGEEPIARVNDDHLGRIIWVTEGESYRATTERTSGVTSVIGDIIKTSTIKPHKILETSNKILLAKYRTTAKADGYQQEDSSARLASSLEKRSIAAAIVVKDMSQEDMLQKLEGTGHDVTVVYPESEEADGQRTPSVALHQAMRAGEEVTDEEIKLAERAERRIGLTSGFLHEYDGIIKKVTGRRVFYRGQRAADKDRELRGKMQQFFMEKKGAAAPDLDAGNIDNNPRPEPEVSSLHKEGYNSEPFSSIASDPAQEKESDIVADSYSSVDGLGQSDTFDSIQTNITFIGNGGYETDLYDTEREQSQDDRTDDRDR
jgi:hypothetical protein